MPTSLLPQISKIKKELHQDFDAVRDFANAKDIYVTINEIPEQNRRVSDWISKKYNIYSPDVNMYNFRETPHHSTDWNWTLECFLEQQHRKFECYFNMEIGKNHKVTISNYSKYEFRNIWRWAFKKDFDDERITTFKTNNKAFFIATAWEDKTIQEFNDKYLKR